MVNFAILQKRCGTLRVTQAEKDILCTKRYFHISKSGDWYSEFGAIVSD